MACFPIIDHGIDFVTFVVKTKKAGEGVRGVIIIPSHSHLLTHLYLTKND